MVVYVYSWMKLNRYYEELRKNKALFCPVGNAVIDFHDIKRIS